MFDSPAGDAAIAQATDATGAAPATTELAAWRVRLAQPRGTLADAERIALIRGLEELKSAASAAQAALTVDFVASQRAAQEAAGVPAAQIGRGISAQVALARRESPFKGGRLVGLAQVLVREMPHTYSALQAGVTSEWRVTLVARATACLSLEDRRTADRELAPRLAQLGDAEVEAAARAVAYRLDPVAFTDRSRATADERRVSLRPAPDTMARLTALLPVAQGVAAYAALTRAADSVTGRGDLRSRGQVMADTLVERVTGQATADAVPVEVQLVMTDRALLRRPGRTDDATPARPLPGPAPEDEPAVLIGYGPLPAPLARDLVRQPDSRVWLRRVFTEPSSAQLIAMESKGRRFPTGLRRLLVVRDQRCRTPWCGAPVRHADHVLPVVQGGVTAAANGAGLCEACNYAKQAHGWTVRSGPGGAGESTTVTTPTGHRYTSRPPPLPGATGPPEDDVGPAYTGWFEMNVPRVEITVDRVGHAA